jgi:uncharacterized protein YcfJ
MTQLPPIAARAFYCPRSISALIERDLELQLTQLLKAILFRVSKNTTMENIIKETKVKTPDANRDPITGTPGAHPVGTGVGAAAGGAATGAAIGTVAGPVGTAIGMAVGAVVGGLIGKGVAEKIDPTVEDGYWRTNYRTRNYVDKGSAYETYQPAYRTGYEGYSRHAGKPFSEVESDLQQNYYANRGTSSLDWDKAKPATRDAWDRLDAQRAAK